MHFSVRPLAGFIAVVALAGPASAQEDTSPGFRGTLSGAGFHTVSGIVSEVSTGFGLGLAYRFSPRLGVELNVSTAEIEDDFDLAHIAVFPLDIASNVRVTPVTLQLDWHLTPGRAADLHIGPVVGWVYAGDIQVTTRGTLPFPGVSRQRRTTEDTFAFGAHVDLDVPLGDRGLFLAFGGTYLDADLETTELEASTGRTVESSFEFDPMIVQIGLGYRF
jgi:outer membrane protein W